MINTLKQHRFLTLFLAACVVLCSCGSEKEETLLQLSPQADSALRDTAYVGFIADSLRKEFFKAATDTARIDILNDLSQNYRAADLLLAEEVLC